MNWTNRPFIDYLNAVDDILERRYGVTSSDTGLEIIANSQESRQTPRRCADEISNQHELVIISNPF